jgi:hypothetical protein
MPIVKLVAEGVGPFDRLELDFSDGDGNPHLGPHILAGVNGSGKSTVLRAIGWLLDLGVHGFHYDEWEHFLVGQGMSRAVVALREPTTEQYARACLFQPGHHSDSLADWATAQVERWGFHSPQLSEIKVTVKSRGSRQVPPRPDIQCLRVEQGDRLRGVEGTRFGARYNVAGYAPSKTLKYLASPSLSATLGDYRVEALAFEGGIQNEAIQAWLLGLYSKRAIANERHQPVQQYTRSLERFESALKLVYGNDVQFDVEIEPNFQPRLRVSGRSLNFSQLPDGVRGTVGWIADFMMRQDGIGWDRTLDGLRPGVLLLDEVDAHLHPLWQRKLLPAMRKALPDVQIIVTSHSPFVISSCPGSRVHVLEVDANGRAHNRPPVDSPIGESVLTTLKEIFGVNSRFDVQTEAELDEWNELKKRDVGGKLKARDRERLLSLTNTLSERSEELRSLVAAPMSIPQSVLEELLADAESERALKQ